MKDRIKQIMESQHMTQTTFASFIGMAPASLSSIFNERTRPTLNTVEAIKSKIPAISLDWLMFGKGPNQTHLYDGNFYTGYQSWKQGKEFAGYCFEDQNLHKPLFFVYRSK